MSEERARKFDATRIRKVRAHLKKMDPALRNAAFEVQDYPSASELFYALHLNHGIVSEIGLVDAITYLIERMRHQDFAPQSSIPQQTIGSVILWSALRSEGLAVALMKLDVDPNVALDIYLEHRSFNPRIYPLVAQGIPFEWAVKISDERILDRNDIE